MAGLRAEALEGEGAKAGDHFISRLSAFKEPLRSPTLLRSQWEARVGPQISQ